ncbi:MAG: ATP phosphoribosyltransferase [Candidatus Kaiserbacteria bacterium]|nr:MAG: ATP phosphoribosyltransferase [Candidatus Kaiserbacteria bacterium]
MAKRNRLNPKRTFGWPSGKNIEEPTTDIFGKANIRPKFSHPRSCIGTFKDLPGFDQCLRLKASEIPEHVQSGVILAAITGLDQVIESGLRKSLKIVANLAYSKASNGGTRGVIVGRRNGPSLKDLRRGGKTILAEYPKAARRWCRKQGIKAKILKCAGGAESLVAAGVYDYCLVLVETGTSLKVNGLVELATVFRSETVLIANRAMYANPEAKEAVDFLAKLLLGAIEARDKRYLTMNVPSEKLDEIVRILPSIESPTMQSLANGDYAVSSVVPLEGLAALKLRLLKAGATGIVELDAHSII